MKNILINQKPVIDILELATNFNSAKTLKENKKFDILDMPLLMWSIVKDLNIFKYEDFLTMNYINEHKEILIKAIIEKDQIMRFEVDFKVNDEKMTLKSDDISKCLFTLFGCCAIKLEFEETKAKNFALGTCSLTDYGTCFYSLLGKSMEDKELHIDNNNSMHNETQNKGEDE